MKRFFMILMTLSFIAAAALPVYALDKRMENNKKLGEFVLDTVKLPLVLMGTFTKQNYEKVKEETGYKGHKGLGECLRK